MHPYGDFGGDAVVVYTKARVRMALDCETIASTGEEEFMGFDSGVGRETRWKRGQSGNPGGRPKSRLLSEALRARLADVKPDDPAGRTFIELVAENLIHLACTQGPGAVAAINEIGNRLEGRPMQAVEISDLSRDIREKSDAELQFYLDNSRWPSDEEKALLSAPVSAPTT